MCAWRDNFGSLSRIWTLNLTFANGVTDVTVVRLQWPLRGRGLMTHVWLSGDIITDDPLRIFPRCSAADWGFPYAGNPQSGIPHKSSASINACWPSREVHVICANQFWWKLKISVQLLRRSRYRRAYVTYKHGEASRRGFVTCGAERARS
jgi:hypothetical protein